MGNINDRAHRDYQQGLVEAVDYRGKFGVAEEPVRAWVQWDERADVCVQNGRIVNISMARD